MNKDFKNAYDGLIADGVPAAEALALVRRAYIPWTREYVGNVTIFHDGTKHVATEAGK